MAKGGTRAKTLGVFIPFMAPILWQRMFLCHNLQIFNDGQLRIICKTKANGDKKYTTQGDGNLPKSFVASKFGKTNENMVQQGTGKEYDSYNADITYDETYGEFKFICDVASRRCKGLNWQHLKPTNDTFPE